MKLDLREARWKEDVDRLRGIGTYKMDDYLVEPELINTVAYNDGWWNTNTITNCYNTIDSLITQRVLTTTNAEITNTVYGNMGYFANLYTTSF